MASTRALLVRVALLELARAPTSPFECWFGSLEAFTDKARAGIAAGEYDSTDMPVVITSIERWHSDRLWA